MIVKEGHELLVVDEQTKEEDIDKTIDLVFEAMEESLYPEASKDYNKLSVFIANCIVQNDKTVIVYKFNDEPVSVLIGHIINGHPYLVDGIASIESVWYTKPEYRGKIESFKLVEAFEYWSKAVGCKYCYMAAQGQHKNFDKVYERKGFHRMEATYEKEIH